MVSALVPHDEAGIPMRILVTGGAGFIGSHLVDALVREGHAVRVLDSFDPQVHGGRRPDYLNAGAEYLEGDVRDRGALARALREVEAVFHEAAVVGVGQSMYEIEKYVSANVLGTGVLLDVIVNDRVPLKKLVVASSMSIYGEGQYACSGCGPVTPPLRPVEQLEARAWEMRCPRCGEPARPDPDDTLRFHPILQVMPVHEPAAFEQLIGDAGNLLRADRA